MHQRVGEPGGAAMVAPEVAFISAPNWAEVWYIVERKVGSTRWHEVRATLSALPLQVLPADGELAEAAGVPKVAKRMSVANCLVAASAQLSGVAVYTGDSEFKAVLNVTFSTSLPGCTSLEIIDAMILDENGTPFGEVGLFLSDVPN